MAGLIRVAARHAGGMFRCGRHWPQAGEVIAVTDLAEADLARIRADPNLRISEVADRDADDGLAAALVEVIGKLAPDQFQQDGKPRLDALRKALPEQKARITAALRDEVWASVTRNPAAGS